MSNTTSQAEFCCGPLVRMEHLGTCKGREEEALNAELAKVAEEKRKAEAGGPLARSFYCSKGEKLSKQFIINNLLFKVRY